MDAVALYNKLKGVVAPPDALVKIFTFTPGFGDMEGEDRFVTLHVVSDYEPYNEGVTHYPLRFRCIDPVLLDFLVDERKREMPFVKFLADLAAIPTVRIPKLRALIE